MKTAFCMKMFDLATVVLFICLDHTYGSAGNEWAYDGEKGPDHWHLDFPHCGGVRQSPVSIKTDEVIVDSEWLVPFTLKGYDKIQNLTMQLGNNGHTVQVDLMIRGEPVSITGGGLKNVYAAQQFHFHWGKEDQRGSEHDIDGIYFPMEMHIVHYNMKYNNFTEALNKEDGLAVLGFFFEVGRYNHRFDRIIKHFSEISYRDLRTQIETFALRDLLPENLDGYYRYYGSLTTPPCYESVIWSIFYQTIQISEDQLDQFRHKVHENYANETNRDISDDYRPPQCLNRRKIHSSKPVVSIGNVGKNNQTGRTSGSATQISVTLITSLIFLMKLLFIFFW
ncbi:hypothetical protein CHS0354_036554 [Potamilus streckersoni]|uniref:Carbonic anhydrase n=1 Tax=Potamilus streckersoni TaxID=2493646 RepID=A0AAE0SY72_9BIVA|nr:hypothetical protein CHS0354_036554 [Potamilus streckersoni]